MGNRILYFLCLLPAMLMPCISIAQKEVLSKIPVKAKTYEAFIPKGFVTLTEVRGDLNKDSSEDIVLVLRDSAAEMESVDMDTDPRRLLLVLFRKDSVYELAGKTDKALMSAHSGSYVEEPLQELRISNGALVIDHYGGTNWVWNYIHKFRYQHGSFYLIGRTYDSYWIKGECGDGLSSKEYIDINQVTGQMEIKKTSKDCKILTHKIKKIKVKSLVKLEAFDINNEVDDIGLYLNN
jgi:hypothetical protein